MNRTHTTLKFVACAVAAVALMSLSGCKQVGTGEKIGFVTKVMPDAGFFCPTMEVEIMRGGMNAGTGAVGQAWHGTVETDKKTFDFLQTAMKEGKEVIVEFRKEFITWCRSESEGNYFITTARYAEQPAQNLPTAPVSVVTPVAVAPAASGAVVPSRETREQKVERLIKVQAELMRELAK